MNIAIVSFGKNPVLDSARKIFAKSLYNKGNIVKEINADLEKSPLVGFQYVIFLVDAGSLFSGGSYESFNKFLKEHDNINTNYAGIYINKRPFANKHFLRYMSLLESFGVIINSSGIIDGDKTAADFIENLKPVKLGA